MFPLRLPYRRTIATVLLSVAFAVTANGAQTVTVSDANLGNEKENWQREVPLSVKLGQGLRSKNLLIAQRQQRIALVIGNGDYQEDPLSNPVNDATDVAKALEELGFEVILLKNLKWQAMDEAIENFSKQLRQGGVGVFYYAGHGVQVNGENYLIPIDARLKRERHVRREAIPLGDVLGFMEEAENQVNIVIIDACRDNPFYRRWRSTRGSTSVRGLSEVDLPPQGTIIAFATGPGEFAEDGEGKRNSPFTSNLLKHIKTPNLEVARMFRQVRAEVLQETDSQQRPWYRESLVGSFFFNPKQEQPSPQPLPSSPTADTSTPSTSPQPRLEAITTVPKPQPEPSTPLSQPGTPLISKATGVDYNPLRNLLKNGKWEEADWETARAMLQAAGREEEGWLRIEDIDDFSCEDLRIIDQLWLESSQGKFGFSVQKEIYQSLGGTREYNYEVWKKLGERVGWRKEENWLPYSQLTYNLQAPRGELPVAGDALVRWSRGLKDCATERNLVWEREEFHLSCGLTASLLLSHRTTVCNL